MPALDPAWIALIGTVCGGIGLKVTEHFLGSKKTKVDDAAKIRDELRIEITAQRDEIAKLEAERDKWREDYYDLRDQFSKLQTEMMIALQDLRNRENGDDPEPTSP